MKNFLGLLFASVVVGSLWENDHQTYVIILIVITQIQILSNLKIK